MSKTNCQCPFFTFHVTDIYTFTEPKAPTMFEVLAICVECDNSRVVATHTMPHDGSRHLFGEHHAMTKEFYEEVK